MLTEPPPSPSNSPSSIRQIANSLWYNLQEDLQDLHLDSHLSTRDVTSSLSSAGRSVQQAARQSGRTVKNTVRSVQQSMADEYSELRADLRVQRDLIDQDVQDLMQSGRGWASRWTSRRRQRDAAGTEDGAPDGNTQQQQPPTPTSSSRGDESPQEAKARILQEIRSFQQTLADPAFVSELNQLVASKLTSARELTLYYQERPELRDFTLETELPRMQYTVFTHDGIKLTEPTEIISYASSTVSQPSDILWRAANQSILGDVLTCLTTPTALVRPQFLTATFIDDITMTVDFGRNAPHVTAECYSTLSIPDGEGNRLVLAGVLLAVYYCPSLDRMEARVIHISPADPLTPAQLETAVDSLLS
eukprot:Nitzschia sp. Nitz4//scaffold26_size159584//67014//68099//NITZ4_002488-RA/size159584-processed-gene-0.71-mRNA-1//-1//CDS//3329545073//7647//frame0